MTALENTDVSSTEPHAPAAEAEPRAGRYRVHLSRSGYAQLATTFAADLMRAYDDWRAEKRSARSRQSASDGIRKSCGYVLRKATHDEQSPTMGVAPFFSAFSMFRRASRRASSRIPACTCSAPQQPWLAGTITSHPFLCNTRTVASFRRAKLMFAMQPPRNATR